MGGDGRSVPVELHFVELFRRLETPLVRHLPDDDVTVYLSGIAHPLCSGALAPAFAPDRALARTDEVLDALFANGAPFQWWMGPLSSDDAIAARLVERGLTAEEVQPGMHCPLDDLELGLGERQLDDDLVIRPCPNAASQRAAVALFVDVFEIPASLVDAFVEVLSAIPEGSGQQVTLLEARRAGELVGSGMIAVLDLGRGAPVAGLYNIAVHPDARRSGVGREVTVELLRTAQDAGCGEAILHSTTMGFSVYEALGFQAVCSVQSWIWGSSDESSVVQN